MSGELENRVWDYLKQVKYPGLSRDIVSFGFVDRVECSGGAVRVDLVVSSHDPQVGEKIRADVANSLAGASGIDSVEVNLKSIVPAAGAQQAVSQDPDLIPGVKHVLAVASGKGGVGKSTVAVNLAMALGRLGHRVGLLDADIYGPSIPMMLGISDQPRVVENRLLPVEKYGIRVMSLGFILDVDTPVIWRGPMVMKAIEQMLEDVDWGELDFMVVDLPPGTGDAQLTISQKVPLSGAVIVSTPQDISLIDARKGLAMFEKVSVPVLGIVENMSSFVCPHCGEKTPVFKEGGARKTAELLGAPFLGQIPLDPAIVEGGDSGVPIVEAQESGPHAEAFVAVANAVVDQVGKRQTTVPRIV